MAEQNQFSFLQAENASYIDELYQQYKEDPSQLDPEWQNFFRGYELGQGNLVVSSGSAGAGPAHVEAYINAYRRLGHMNAQLSPLSTKEKQQNTN